MKRLFKFADKVIVNSLDFKKEFIKYFNIKPIVIYNSIENEDYLLKNYNKKVNFNFFDNSNDSHLKFCLLVDLLIKKTT